MVPPPQPHPVMEGFVVLPPPQVTCRRPPWKNLAASRTSNVSPEMQLTDQGGPKRLMQLDSLGRWRRTPSWAHVAFGRLELQ